MRRYRTSTFQPDTLRIGVIARVSTTKRSVQVPVSLVIVLMGFAPSRPSTAAHASHATGTRQAAKTAHFETTRLRRITASVVLPQIHPCVHRRDLVAIPVEFERRPLQELADPALLRLAPARVIDLRVHIRVEAVLPGLRLLPGRTRLALDETNADDGLDALESVLPGDDQANRCTVLVGQD